MEFKELLKAQSLTDEQINNITAKMKEEKIYTTSLENADERYTKLKGQKADLDEQIKAANTTYPTTNNRTYPTRKIQILGDCRCKTLEIA